MSCGRGITALRIQRQCNPPNGLRRAYLRVNISMNLDSDSIGAMMIVSQIVTSNSEMSTGNRFFTICQILRSGFLNLGLCFCSFRNSKDHFLQQQNMRSYEVVIREVESVIRMQWRFTTILKIQCSPLPFEEPPLV